MSDSDIREALRALRTVPVPEMPSLSPTGSAPRSSPLPVLLAISLLVAVLGVILLPHRRPSPPPTPEPTSPTRLQAVEARIRPMEDDELKGLLQREAELLRRERELVEDSRRR